MNRNFVFKTSISFSSDPREAVENCISEAYEGLKDVRFAFLFTTDSYDHRVIWETARVLLRGVRFVGLCSGGVIFKDEVYRKAIGVCLIGGEIEVCTSIQGDLSRDPKKVGTSLGEELLESGIREGTVFVFPDGFSSKVSEALKALYEVMGPYFDYVGGCAGDNLRFFKTYQFTEKELRSDAIAAVLIKGIRITSAFGHGWRPTGHYFVITEAKGKTVYKLDEREAFSAYCEAVGPIPPERFAEIGLRYPFGFSSSSGYFLIRDPLKVNPGGSIEFVTEVPVHALGYIMETTKEEMIGTARKVAKEVKGRSETPSLALIFDCVSRCILLGKKFQRELLALKEELGEGVGMIGILTFGEIGCLEGVPFLHNKTLLLVTLG